MATTTDSRTKKIIATGRAQAIEVAARREQALKKRAKVLAELGPEAAGQGLVQAEGVEAVAATRGHLIAEGDSWFDYPGVDVVRVLEDELGFDVESVAHSGDRVEMMAFGRDQLTKFSAAIEKVIRRNGTPKGILLSGGGNDIAGKEFGFLINHVGSPNAGANESIVRGVIDERCRDAYIHILAAITKLCEQKLGRKVPILVHGYGHVVPDGRGFLGGAWFLPGPWLEPGFIEKGFNALAERQPIVDALIDRFNVMLQGVRALAEFRGHVKHVDLREVLPNSPNKKTFWANELHPTDRGFRAVAAAFAEALRN